MKPTTQRRLRQWHHYIGVFFAPAILFFTFTGGLQTFSLHEAKGYGGKPPPAWIAWMSSVHKDQAPPREQHAGPAKPTTAAAPAKAAHVADRIAAPAGAKRPSPLPLKIFVALLAASLFCSTLLGVIIALNNRTMRTRSIGLLIVGAVLPCVLLWL
ncbi:MAG: hypothetical protein M3R41_01595 [Pseudomonadota bacterium]|nr:hypothetical protein [Pseudomonadota bacterium]